MINSSAYQRGDEYCKSCPPARKSTVSGVRDRLAPDNALDLFVISHINLDHIEGAIELLEGKIGLAVGEV
ncbi:hypothetical protein [Bradyrhizobium sp. 76]|uniref:hypothetical protein n=1 Tax=Bradyrhizobium sp. 76 TaxID=2782680 RepID=UPI001FFAC650|nr:hypothetical protein [Bradyrhizobium sp. 76]MCK1411482.1 hypothetical protein [Bradyrhizobium sp. 76]